MDTDFVFKQVQEMRPSSFSEKEQHCYQAEKMMLRQFMLMKQQDQVPAYLSVTHMKTWLLTGRNFMEEFQEMIGRLEIKHLLMAELAWTTARRDCVNEMEQELLEDLDKEKRLSLLFRRKVTLEGLQMFLSVIRPKAEESVKVFLPSLHSKLLKFFVGIRLCPVSAGVEKVPELLELERSTAPVIAEIVHTALKFLLEEPEIGDKTEAASAEVGRLLTDSAAPCLSQYRPVSTPLLLGVCTVAGRYMVRAIFKKFDHRSKTFHQMDYNESSFSAREGVISAIQDMDCEVQTSASSQAHLQLSTSEGLKEGLMEKMEASPGAAATEGLKEGLLEEKQPSPGVAATEGLKEGLLEEKQPSPGVAATEGLKEGLLEEKQPSPGAAATEGLKEGLLEEKEAASRVAATEGLKEGLLEEKEPSPGVAATEGLKEGPLEEKEAAPEDLPVEGPTTVTTSMLRLETNVVVHMELKVLQEDAEAQDFSVKRKKKKRVRAFFRGIWKTMSCCFRGSSEH